MITEKALDFIDRNASKSFFLYFTPTLPHAELIVPKESLQEFDGKLMLDGEYDWGEPAGREVW